MDDKKENHISLNNSDMGSLYSFQSRESKFIDDDHSSNYLAISPNGELAATFNSESYELKIYYVNNLTAPNKIHYDEMRRLNLPSVKISFSLAISNSSIIQEVEDAFVAISCFCDQDMMSETEDNGSVENSRNPTDAERGDDFKTKISAETFVYSVKLDKRIETTVDKYGGIVRFLNNSEKDDQSNGFTNLIVMNASGIAKAFINHKNPCVINKSIFKDCCVTKVYEFPTTIQNKIDKLYQESPCTRFLNSIVVNNFLFVEDYRNQRLELYNLQSLDLELTLRKRDEISLSTQARGNPIFSISKYGHLLAYCNGTKSITIHLMENGLEVTTKIFTTANKILSISFIDDDERLFVVTEEASGYGENGKIKFTPMINILDLFTFKNDIRKFDDQSNIFGSLQKSISHSIVFSNGVILATLQDGTICSVLELSNVKSKLKPYISHDLLPININQVQENSLKMDQIFHTIFQQDGIMLDAKKEHKRVLVVNNKEPWIHHKQYKRISTYLDEEKTIQLIIGETTVQVWSKKGHGSINKKVLEYIWVNPSNKMITVASLKIGKREFLLDLTLPSTIAANLSQSVKIHWPNEAHVLKDACVAMEYLYERRDEPVGPKNQGKYEDLVADTEKLIKKCVKKNPGLWSLSEIRYDIMTNVIRSKYISLLHQILFEYKKADDKKQDKTKISRYLHIPREYQWPMRAKESDLMIAIEKSSGGLRRDTVIVAMLLEYYSNNAEKDTGWMFTVTKALPFLNNRYFEPYLKELFYKPCFGSKEEHIDSKFISQNKLKKGYKSEICSLNLKPRLLLKQNESSLWNTFKSKNLKRRSKVTDEEVTQITTVRVVPLPDFTVYPENAVDRKHSNWMIPLKLIKLIFWPRGYLVRRQDQRSPFLRLLRKNENEQLFDNPAMEACIDFKWISGIFEIKDDSNLLHAILLFIFFYMGYYLLATEFVQLRYEGFKRYWSIYNFLDLASIILPLVTMINYKVIIYKWIQIVLNDPNYDENDPYPDAHIEQVLKDHGVIMSDGIREVYIQIAFAVLLLWFELLMTTVAFGHAMHVILKDPASIGLQPNGNSFVIEDPNPDSTIDTKITQEFDIDKPIDNYYVKFPYAVMGVYFWILGRWDQLEVWDFWPIYVFSIAASILLVIIMQNLLVAFMTGVYENARNNVKVAVLSYRADLIADYETLEKPFGSLRGNPRYIYYVGSSEYQEEWLDKAEKYRKTHKSLLVEDINSQILKANEGKDVQTFRLTVNDHEDKNIVTNNEFLKLRDEMKMLQNDVKELLS
ncbi:15061_t:CDS:2, partial [Funneliformis geosporum]